MNMQHLRTDRASVPGGRHGPTLMLMAFALAQVLAADAFAGNVMVEIDTNADRRSINPDIYGVNFGEDSQLADPGYTVRRWGGNSTTRYNWQTDVHNTAGDWFFMNIANGDGTGLPGNSTLNQMAEATLNAGASPLVTIATIGWTPDPERVKKWAFSVADYGAQTVTECTYFAEPPQWCTADAGNGECNPAENQTGFCVDNRIVGNDPDDTSFATDQSWALGWVQHLVARHGGAAGGGVRYYALDNEVMLWNSTHRDVHPEPATYDEVWSKAVSYGSAIKQADPDALVFGPVTWGYCDLFGSAADNCMDGPDRQAHDGVPFVQWYLRQICAYQEQNGVRLVDYLDLHYYPQGDGVVDFNGNLGWSESADVAARRLRSLKELHDPDWVSESWIADLGDFDANHYSRPGLLPRVRAWIDAECPGTRLAITEYNWGPDQGATGALAQAEVLAIFGREGVDLATRWVAPPPGSLVERAFRLFLNFDGAGSRVEGASVRAQSSDADAVGSYAVDLPGERLMVLLFNKSTSANGVQVNFGQSLSGAWTLYQFTGSSDLGVVDSGTVNGSGLSIAGLPPRSASLLVLPAVNDVIFADGLE
jgi:hypothetical protein